MDRALRLIPSTIGSHRAEGPGVTIVDVGGPDADGLARYLLGLATPLRVLSPESVRQALLRRTRELFEENTPGFPRQSDPARERPPAESHAADQDDTA